MIMVVAGSVRVVEGVEAKMVKKMKKFKFPIS